jgi:hypothetical protein
VPARARACPLEPSTPPATEGSQAPTRGVASRGCVARTAARRGFITSVISVVTIVLVWLGVPWIVAGAGDRDGNDRASRRAAALRGAGDRHRRLHADSLRHRVRLELRELGGPTRARGKEWPSAPPPSNWVGSLPAAHGGDGTAAAWSRLRRNGVARFRECDDRPTRGRVSVRPVVPSARGVGAARFPASAALCRLRVAGRPGVRRLPGSIAEA